MVVINSRGVEALNNRNKKKIGKSNFTTPPMHLYLGTCVPAGLCRVPGGPGPAPAGGVEDAGRSDHVPHGGADKRNLLLPRDGHAL